MNTGFVFRGEEYPSTPGVYLMKGASGSILYVGKAKALRKRLASYFRPGARLTPKTSALVARVRTVDTLLASTEKEALLLEASLIKKHRPPYNIVLRDDKQYVLFRLEKNGEYPRLLMTRRVVRDGSVYFGPFTSAAAARQTWKLIGKAFPLRKCSDNVFRNRVRPCLYYDIGQCWAPCVRDVDKTAYKDVVRRVEFFLRGRTSELLATLEREMQQHAEGLRFEQAAESRDLIRDVRRTLERQTAVLQREADLDVLALTETSSGLGLGQLFVRQGRLLDEKRFSWPGLTLDEGPEVLQSFLVQFYEAGRIVPERIVLPYELDVALAAELLTERRGGLVRVSPATTSEERGLVDLARTVAARPDPREQVSDITELLRSRLRLGAAAERIEGVDASHLSGQGLRVGQVVFVQGRPVTSEYRLFAFPELEGASDDYGALAAWARRRVDAGPPWPDLILLDGGKGQLAVVERAFAECRSSGVEVPFLELSAIAKGPSRRAGELEDRIFRPGRKNHVNLKSGSPELLFLQRVRDEAHRFVLGMQRRSRKKQILQSEVQALPGIGPKTARLLWDHFGSLEAMLAADVPALRNVSGIGAKRAAQLHTALSRLRTSRGSSTD
ncbi:MAG: excinuclease ABC subunit UvrC [Desulfovibrionaceae bacterium]